MTSKSSKNTLSRPVSSSLLKETAHRIFKFFASLKLAIFVLLTLMAVLATGTFIESAHGTEAGRIVIYRSPWFALLLCVLGINVAAAALDRYPWKKKHVGFVITHLGIILVLTGSMITQKTVIDGQMAISEGDTEYRITLPEPILYIFSENRSKHWILPLGKHAFAWQGRQKVENKKGEENLPFSIHLLADYPKARIEENIQAAVSGPPGVKILVKNSFVNQTQWLVENDPAYGEVQLGPAKLKFTQEFLKETSGPEPEAGYLEFQFLDKKLAGQPILISLAKNLKLPATFPLEGTPYQIKILRLFKSAAVEGKNLVEQENDSEKISEWKNPAAELLLEGKGLQEKHTVFSKFPDFPTVHGMKPSEAGARIFYRIPGGGSRGESHELRFVQKDSELFYQIQDGFKVTTGKVESGKETGLGWMDLTFKVETYYPHAIANKNFTAVSNLAEGANVLPALKLEVGRPTGSPLQFWLFQGSDEKIEINGTSYQLIYGERRIPAGFKLMLRDFRVENYPGTNRPASFESDVTLKDDSRGVVKDVTISMNEPLRYRGYKIYQSGYTLPSEGAGPEERETSIFSVGRDPGVPVTYLGAIVMIGGIITMFYTRKFSSHGGRLQ